MSDNNRTPSGRKKSIDKSIEIARISTTIPEDVHTQIQIYCLKNKLTLSDYFARAVLHQFERQQKTGEIF